MNKNSVFKTITARLMVLTLIMGVVLGYPIQTFAVQETNSPMSLDSMIEEVMKVNPSIKLLDDKIAVQERRCYYANSTSDAVRTKAWSSDSQHIQNKTEELLNPLQAKNTLDNLKWERQNKVIALKTEASNLLFQYNYKLQEIEAQSNVIERAKKDLDIAKKKVEVGNQNSLSLSQSENAISVAERQLETLNMEKTDISMKINSLLQRDLTQKISLKDEQLKIEEYKIDDLELLISKQKESSHSVIKLQNDYEENKIELFVQSYAMVEKSDTYDQLEDTKLELEYSIKNEKAAVELKIRSDYNSLLNLKDDMEIAKLTYDLNSKLNSVSEIKYNRGLISISEYLKTAGDKEDALIKYNKAQLDYVIAVMNFKMYIEDKQSS